MPSYRFEPCTREEAMVQDVDDLAPMQSFWVRTIQGEIMRWLEPNEPLPLGVEYVRPVDGKQ